MCSLARRFLETLDDLAEPPAMSLLTSLEEHLKAALAKAEAAWKGVELAPEAFVVHLATHLCRSSPTEESLEQRVSRLARLHSDDLYLACACGQGDKAALAVFQERFQPEIEQALHQLRLDDDTRQEAVQQALERVLVANESRPARIASYSGRGSLAGWLRVTAVHLALNGMRANKRAPESLDESVSELPDGSHDPELALLKELYSGEFRFAFKGAWAELDARERALLSFSYLDQLTIDEIAPIYQVHRATVARWLVRARAALLESTRAQLVDRLGLSQSDFDSIMGLIDSRLDFTVRSMSVERPEEL
ncbi:MAG: sigma-70 family RNA polymerase sigma factor [Deltaproteobacteria bacterium]|nr:sigma-70 family RNA polymerase sigma factor [Deltaproteobacteria bacterium]